MKLIRYGQAGREAPGLLHTDGTVRSLAGIADDVSGDALLPRGLDTIREADPDDLPLAADAGRIGPCIGAVGKIVCVGRNYAEHAREGGAEVPKEPTLFQKATSSICGPDDDLVIPKDGRAIDYEVELAVVIGTPAAYVSEDAAMSHVAGYCLLNDVTERDWQRKREGQWTKGKSADTFCPLGPWFVTADEVPDPQALRLWTEVDGTRRQDGTTADMVYGVRFLVSYVSRFMSLQTGDVIATGTPAGVGAGMDPPGFLRAGHTLRCGVEGLGEQTRRVVEWTGVGQGA